jgi:hypothetical protein
VKRLRGLRAIWLEHREDFDWWEWEAERRKFQKERSTFAQSVANAGKAVVVPGEEGLIYAPLPAGSPLELHVPRRSGKAPWSYPLRVALTPISLTADIILLPAHALMIALAGSALQ